MAVDSLTYGTVAGVEALIGDIVASRTFTDAPTATTPSLTEAEKALDDIADEINVLLDAYGYTVKINATDYPIAHGFMVAANEAGAAARLLGSVPPNVYDPDEEIVDAGTSRQQTYQNMLNRCFSRIRKLEIRAGMRQSQFEHVFSGAQEDDDGNTKKPMFTRDLHAHPQSPRSLTE